MTEKEKLLEAYQSAMESLDRAADFCTSIQEIQRSAWSRGHTVLALDLSRALTEARSIRAQAQSEVDYALDAWARGGK